MPDPYGTQDLPRKMSDAERYKLTVRYDGSGFHGWQKQVHAGKKPLRTIQGVLEDAVRHAVRQPVTVVGASRTDAGVHAEGQVAAFTTATACSIPLERLHLAINRWLADDLAVIHVERTALDFAPINDAISKAYRYTIHNAIVRPVFDRHGVYHCWYDLDVRRMNAAAQVLVGEHDFASFANTHHGRESTVRTVRSCAVTREDQLVHIDIIGNGFLYHMVRIIVGTLVEIGRGRREVEDMARTLAAADRSAAGPTLAAAGLCLKWIRYPAGD